MKINRKIYDTTHKKELNDICARNMHRTWKNYGFIIILIISSIACASFSPIYVFVKYNKHTSFAQLKIPCLKEDSSWEFGVNCIIQFIAGVFVVLGNIGIEGVLVLFVNSLNVTTDISKYEYDEFSTMLLLGDLSKSEINVRISRMCQQIQTVDR